jgi:transglutaminase-like putative cysteine protease
VRTSTRMTLAAGAAVALGAAPLGAVFEEWRWIWYAWAAIAAVVGAQLLARSVRLPAALVPVAGAAGLLVYLTVVFTSRAALLGLVPTPESLRLLRTGLDRGLTNVNELAAPVPATTGLLLLTAASIGAVAIVVDLVAVGLRRPAASGLALLALYAVPTAVAVDGVPWVLFAVGATGYLLLLLVEGRDRLLRWGRPVGGGTAADGADADAPLPLTGQRIGAAAIALAVVVPLLVPGLTGNALSRIGRTGSSTGSGTGGALNEFAALRGELRRNAPLELMRVTTSLERPHYLRTKVLDRYSSGGFSSTPDDFDQEVDQRLTAPNFQERISPEERTFTTDIRLTDNYRDDHLPIYYWPSQLTSLGDSWGYDDTKAVVGREDRLDDGLEYTVTSVAPEPTVDRLVASGPLPDQVRDALPTQVTLVPQSLPREVRDTVERVTGGTSVPYLKAKALNDYFTDGTEKFTYSDQTVGNGSNALLQFLRNKQGYCEQYAAAMAVMLRVAGIPSRVVIGYTPGRQQDDGTYSVTTHDAHAWVEAFFSDVGWVYFDPTPLQDGRTVAPDYAPRPAASPTPSVSAATGVAGSPGPTADQLDPADTDPGVASSDSSGDGLLTPQRAMAGGGVLVGVLLLLTPALVRWSARRRRLRAAAGQDAAAAARAAWDELLGSATDYGVSTPRTETPRGLVRRLGRDLSLDAEATRGLRLVALAEERARYAVRAGVDGDLAGAVRAVRRGLRADAGRRRRWRATLLPPSTVHAARTGSAVRAANASSALSRLGEAVRRPVTPRRR